MLPTSRPFRESRLGEALIVNTIDSLIKGDRAEILFSLGCILANSLGDNVSELRIIASLQAQAEKLGATCDELDQAEENYRMSMREILGY